MGDSAIGWIAAVIIGGIAGRLAEQFMKSDMGLLINIVLGIVGAAIASAILAFFWNRSRRMDRLPDCWVHRRVFADLGRPRATGPHSVRMRATSQLGTTRRSRLSPISAECRDSCRSCRAKLNSGTVRRPAPAVTFR
jgi:uncharacterized membrane protein YeaQ/YmgE (transglycosylase-associated protein family)